MNRRLGRYVVRDELAAGGMGKVHLGQLRAEGGFSRVVAIKVLLPQYAREPEVRRMFLDEARLVASIRHPNVASTLDVLEDQGELFLVMDYVNGLPLSQIVRDVLKSGGEVPLRIATAILIDALLGLHAAHEVCDEAGAPLAIVHRDVSPQNIMVGDDGLARVVDFGVAHATGRLQRTMPGQVKGKASYMAPEQALEQGVDRRADVYGAGIVLWEALAGGRLFDGSNMGAILLQNLQEKPRAPSSVRSDVPPALDAVVLRALEKRPADRFPTAMDMAEAIEHAVGRATRSEVAAWLEATESGFFAQRRELLSRLPREPIDLSLDAPSVGERATLPDGPRAKLTSQPTQLAGDSQLLLAGRTDDNVPGRERRQTRAALGGAVLVTALAVVLLAGRARSVTPSATASPSATPLGSSSSSRPETPPAPPAVASAPAVPPVVSALPSSEPVATGKTRRAIPAVTPTANTAHVATPSSASSHSRCCAGRGLQVNFDGDCAKVVCND